MIRIEAYAVLNGLTVHVAAHNMSEEPAAAGESGVSVTRVIPPEDIEKYGIEHCIKQTLAEIFYLYAGLAQYALR